jgi:putative nucleotidyltransferase with HDIG domain
VKLNKIKKAIDLVRELPTLPTVAVKVNTLLGDPKSSVRDLSQIIENDQSITTKILKLVNSAQYNLPEKISNITQAIALLGYRNISYIVMTLSVFDTLKSKTNKLFDRKEFWTHSIATALMSRRIATHCSYKNTEDVFTAGLLHDIGKVFMDGYMNEEFMSVINLAQEKSISYHDAEKELFDVNHAMIGEWIARTWQLPLHVTGAIKHHHQGVHQRKGLSVSSDIFIDYVVLADRGVRIRKFGANGDGKDFTPILEPELFERLPLSENDFLGILDDLEKDVSRSQTLLDFAV